MRLSSEYFALSFLFLLTVSTSLLFPRFAMGVSPSKTFGHEAAKIVSKAVISNFGSNPATVETIVLGAGCFWGVELAFQRVPGVIDTAVGYAQGVKANPTYEEVCTGSTRHSEVVKVSYDNAAVSLDELLTVFWDIHDPTTLNRQGNDVGTQYRSGIYYNNDIQRDIITRSRDRQQQLIKDGSIVTEIEKLTSFYPAEEYHQKYLQRGGQCSLKGDLTPIRCYG